MIIAELFSYALFVWGWIGLCAITAIIIALPIIMVCFLVKLIKNIVKKKPKRGGRR